MLRSKRINTQKGEGAVGDALIAIGKMLLPAVGSFLSPVAESAGKKVGSLIHRGSGARLAGAGSRLAGGCYQCGQGAKLAGARGQTGGLLPATPAPAPKKKRK